MQRKELVALVAGTTIGVGGGALSAFVAWAAAEAAVHRFLDELGGQDIELRPPVPPPVPCAAEWVSQSSSPVTQLARDKSLPSPKEAVTSAQTPREPWRSPPK